MISRYKRIGKEGRAEHRVVMEEHLGRKLRSDEQVHHINHDRFDNRIENLMVVNAKEHGKLHSKYEYTKVCKVCGKAFTPNPTKRARATVCSDECKHILAIENAKKRMKPIKQLGLDGTFIKEWESARTIRNATGFFESNINKCCKGKIKSYKGYKWEYAS